MEKYTRICIDCGDEKQMKWKPTVGGRCASCASLATMTPEQQAEHDASKARGYWIKSCVECGAERKVSHKYGPGVRCKSCASLALWASGRLGPGSAVLKQMKIEAFLKENTPPVCPTPNCDQPCGFDKYKVRWYMYCSAGCAVKNTMLNRTEAQFRSWRNKSTATMIANGTVEYSEGQGVRRTYQGIYKCKNPKKYAGDPTGIVYRSSWEKAVFIWADNNTEVLEWSSEEIVIPYRYEVDNRVHRYFPDVFLKMRTGPPLLVEILDIVRTQGRATVADAAKITGTSRNTIKDHLKALTDSGHLVRHGAGRGTWYALA